VPALHYPDPPLGAGDVSLRPYRWADLDDLVRELSDPEVPRWTNVPPNYGRQEGEAFLGQAEAQRLAGRALTLAIGDPLRGAVGLTDVDWHERRAEVGYWVAASSRGRGLASLAVRMLSDWALSQAGLERLDLYANPANEASQRVAEKAGYTREGLLRELRYRQGERETLYVFSRLASDV
jgi:[ribosomal protein S5]-alanine N-acetyltransferase